MTKAPIQLPTPDETIAHLYAMLDSLGTAHLELKARFKALQNENLTLIRSNAVLADENKSRDYIVYMEHALATYGGQPNKVKVIDWINRHEFVEMKRQREALRELLRQHNIDVPLTAKAPLSNEEHRTHNGFTRDHYNAQTGY